MGIKSLTYLIKTKCSEDCIETTNLKELSGKKIAIDASLFIYQALLNVRSNGNLLTNKDNKTVSHIYGIYNKNINLLSMNIEPIWIFDGKPPKEKRDVIDKRKKFAQECKEKINKETDVEKRKQLEKKSLRLTYEHIDQVKELLRMMGISYIDTVEGEAEGLASELCRIGHVDYVMTEDMDSLVFGCPRLIRKCIHKNKEKDAISVFQLDKILQSLDLTTEQFIELCILCGCDYCPSINKIGNITAYKLIKQHDTIENILNYNKEFKKYEIPEDYYEKYQISKTLFDYFKKKIDVDTIDIKTSELDFQKLETYLTEFVNMDRKKIQSSFHKIRCMID